MNRLMGCLAALTLAACASATLQAAPQATAGEARLLLAQSLPNSGTGTVFGPRMAGALGWVPCMLLGLARPEPLRSPNPEAVTLNRTTDAERCRGR